MRHRLTHQALPLAQASVLRRLETGKGWGRSTRDGQPGRAHSHSGVAGVRGPGADSRAAPTSTARPPSAALWARPPRPAWASSTVTRAPRCRSAAAAANPPTPAPPAGVCVCGGGQAGGWGGGGLDAAGTRSLAKPPNPAGEAVSPNFEFKPAPS